MGRLLALLIPYCLGLAVSAAPTPAPAQKKAKDPFLAQQAEYEKYLRRLPFLMHTRGRVKFARSQDPRALEIMAQSYAKPERPKEHVQYLLVSICCQHFDEERHLALMHAWRNRHHRPQDAWLWYRSLLLHYALRGSGELYSILGGKEDIFLRAAALEALAKKADHGLLALIPELLANLPRREIDHAVMLESLASALVSQKHHLGSKEFRDAAAPLIHKLDDEKTPRRSKLVIARHLGRIFGTDTLVVDARPWIVLLAGETGPKDKYAHRYAKPRFFGVEATGTRICYVIDMSDSMLAPLSGDLLEKKRKRKGPITGPRRTAKRKKGELPTEDDLPWDRIHTRFDLAREHLKLSLLRLSEDTAFTVIWFGDKAGLLSSCTGMMLASKVNVHKVGKELDSIRSGPPIPLRPHGTLRGKTNLHGGIRRAFQVRRQGLCEVAEYVDAKASLEGCDTIFVLSDGDPTWDDWPTDDKDYHEDRIGDPESRKKVPPGTIMHYSGPYREWDHLIDDVERMNLFRKVEIQCIGIGEAQLGFLDRLARAGHGRAHRVGWQ